MIKFFSILLFLVFAIGCFSQTMDSAKLSRAALNRPEMPTPGFDSVKKQTHIDSVYNFQVVIPVWLRLKQTAAVYDRVTIPSWQNAADTGVLYEFGGTLPAVYGVENTIKIKIFEKRTFSTLSDFKKFIVGNLQYGQSPKWSRVHKSRGIQELTEWKQIGTAYRVYLEWDDFALHCQYVLIETKSAYLWVDYTSTLTTFKKNLSKFEEFLDGLRVTNF